MLLISRRDRQECIVSSHLKSTAYKNKISLKLGYRTVKRESMCGVPVPFIYFRLLEIVRELCAYKIR